MTATLTEAQTYTAGANAPAQMYMPIWPGPTPADGPGDVYTRELATAGPRAGDDVQLWTGGPLWSVARHYWTPGGRLELHLMPAIVDATCTLDTERAWYTGQSGDLVAQLTGAGWRRLITNTPVRLAFGLTWARGVDDAGAEHVWAAR